MVDIIGIVSLPVVAPRVFNKSNKVLADGQCRVPFSFIFNHCFQITLNINFLLKNLINQQQASNSEDFLQCHLQTFLAKKSSFVAFKLITFLI